MRGPGRFWPIIVSAGIVVGPGSLLAQAEPDAPEPHPCDVRADRALRVCRAAYDGIAWMVPAASLAAGTGNPGLGTAAGSKGFGDLTLTLRASYASAVLPATAYDGVSDTVGAARRFPIVGPRLDVMMGLFRKELPVGAASADLIGSVLLIPKSATEYLRFNSDARSAGGLALGFGYGLRLAMEPKAPMPTVSLNVLKSDLPAFTFGDLSQGSTYAYSLAVSTINARLLVGKRFGAFELVGGGGADLVKGSYSVSYKDPADGSIVPRADSTQSTMRFSVVTNASVTAGIFRVTLEAGFQVGKDEKLTTIFESNNTRAGRFFGGIGLGIRL